MSRLREVPKLKWWTRTSSTCDGSDESVIRVFKSDRFLVQIRKHKDTIRLSVNKVVYCFSKGGTSWEDGITWDELQDIKNQCGYRDFWMCEYYPPEKEVVNVANIRHLWLMDSAPENTLRDSL